MTRSILERLSTLNGPLTERSVHLCLDMQRLFGANGPWPTPWADRTLPLIAAIAGRYADRTIFTRFIPPRTPEELPGTWQRYYRRWRDVTLDRLDPAFLELMPPLGEFAPPAVMIDKRHYSAFAEPHLEQHLRQREADALVVTGAETDMCVLATVLGAIDLGRRVVIVADAVCSSSDEGHEALLNLYHQRFSEQVEVIDTRTLFEVWPPSLRAAGSLIHGR